MDMVPVAIEGRVVRQAYWASVAFALAVGTVMNLTFVQVFKPCCYLRSLLREKAVRRGIVVRGHFHRNMNVGLNRNQP